MSKSVRLTQIDGALPNLALMKLSHWHRTNGDSVHLTREIYPTLLEPEYDVVYGSSIFEFSEGRRRMFRKEWPAALLGGTGTINKMEVEEITGGYDHWDYTDYPEFDASLGYTQRGCRMSGPKSPCRAFCVVPDKEGFPKKAQTIAEIWRGDPWPKKLHLLDNDFFGGPEWRLRIEEIRDGGFRVCMSQGINTRLITKEAAEALATIQYAGDWREMFLRRASLLALPGTFRIIALCVWHARPSATTDGQQEVSGEADTLAGAIMDALSKAAR